MEILKDIYHQVFSQCGMTSVILLVIAIVEGFAIKILFGKFMEVLKNTNALMGKLIERVNEDEHT